jgi:hypothetical protein
MQTQTKYEEEILKEIQELPEIFQLKLARVLCFLKHEMIEERVSEAEATEEFLSVCGTWQDTRSVEEQIQDIYSARRSTNRAEQVWEDMC